MDGRRTRIPLACSLVALLLLGLHGPCDGDEKPGPASKGAPKAAPPKKDAPRWQPTAAEAEARRATAQRGETTSRRDAARARDNAALRAAFADDDTWWAFLIAPTTPYLDREAAVYKRRRRDGADYTDSNLEEVLPFDWFPRIVRTLAALEHEQWMHQWGLRENPSWGGTGMERMVLGRMAALTGAKRERKILGSTWRVPRSFTGWHPVNAKERASAPWPLQVQHCLRELLRHARPRVSGAGRVHARHTCDALLAAALAMPVTTDEEAGLFLRVCRYSSHHTNARVLARYRRIVLDPGFPQTAERVLTDIPHALRLWSGKDAQRIGQVVLIDALASKQPERLKHHAGYMLGRMREGRLDGRSVPWPQPVTAILAVARRGLDPAAGDAWSRLYAYLMSACEALDKPPFKADRRLDPKDAAPWIDKFRAWFAKHEAELEAAAAKEAPRLAQVRARLIALEQR